MMSVELDGSRLGRAEEWPEKLALRIDRAQDKGNFRPIHAVSLLEIKTAAQYAIAHSTNRFYWGGRVVFADTDAEPGVNYTYRALLVQASRDCSPPSNAVSVHLPVPVAAHCRPGENGGLVLSWEALAGGSEVLPEGYELRPFVGPWLFGGTRSATGQLALPLPYDFDLETMTAGVRVMRPVVTEVDQPKHTMELQHRTLLVPALTADGDVFLFGDGCPLHLIFPDLRLGYGRFPEDRIPLRTILPSTEPKPDYTAWRGWSMEVSEQDAGFQPWQIRHLQGWHSPLRYVEPGRHEFLTFLYRVKPEGSRSVHAGAEMRFARPPPPTNFRVHSGNGYISVRWKSFSPLANAWLSPPEWVVLRAEEKGNARLSRDCLHHVPVEVARLPADRGEWTDHAVVNGACYAYSLQLHGDLRLTTTLPEIGSFDHALPLRLVVQPGNWVAPGRCCRWGVPHEARPLRIGVAGDPDVVQRWGTLVSQFQAQILASPDMVCLERSRTIPLQAERELANLHTGSEPEPPRPTAVQAADLLVAIREQTLDGTRRGEIWLHDFMNGRFRRIASVTPGEKLTETSLAKVLDTLRENAPGPIGPKVAVTPGPQKCSIAVMDWQPVTMNQTAGAQSLLLQTALETAMARMQVTVVERGKINVVFSELDQADYLSDQAPRLGHILGADLILCGRWQATKAGWHVMWRLVDSDTGQLLHVGSTVGPDRDTAATTVACRITGLLQPPASEMEDATWRVLDAVASTRHSKTNDVRHIVSTAAAVAPDDARFEADLGRYYCRIGQLDMGESHLRNALTCPAPPVRDICITLSEVFRARGRIEDELAVWREWFPRMTQHGPRMLREPLLAYAEALSENGRHEEAVALLGKYWRPAMEQNHVGPHT
jgi:hypothetical protein